MEKAKYNKKVVWKKQSTIKKQYGKNKVNKWLIIGLFDKY